MSSVQQIIDRQIGRWQVEKSALERFTDEEAPSLSHVKPVVTLSRQRGCRGREMAKFLAHELHYGLFDQKIVEAIADDAGVKEDLVESLDEKDRSVLELWIQNILEQKLFDYDDYIRELAKVLKTMAMQGGVVIVGRGSNLVLIESSAFHIRLVAPREVRIRNIMESEGMNEAQAIQEMERVDHSRARFIKKYFRQDIDNPMLYDLVINMGKLSIEAGAKIILSALRARGYSIADTGGDKRSKAQMM